MFRLLLTILFCFLTTNLHAEKIKDWNGRWIFFKIDNEGREDSMDIELYLDIDKNKIRAIEDDCRVVPIVSYELTNYFVRVNFIRNGIKHTALLERTERRKARVLMVEGVFNSKAGVPKDTKIIARRIRLSSACIRFKPV